MNKTLFQPVYDPYDLWSTKLGISVKHSYYSGKLSGKLEAVFIGVIDWLLPELSRKILAVTKITYPIVSAQAVLILSLSGKISNANANELLEKIKTVSSDPSGKSGWSWGLGFPWMSKNGLYSESLAFITHTPYAMEALLELSKQTSVAFEAKTIFDNTWEFLESLLVMYQKDNQLALSYAPVNEPRMVVNANTYAAFAYALHAVYGKKEHKTNAMLRVRQLINWVMAQQQKNGSWFYYADNKPGNFIDCFHSCFILKNMLKIKSLLPEISDQVEPVIRIGWLYIQTNLYDKKMGLCRRFIRKDHKDPFRWDLYDQAEYLGLLVDFGLLEEAKHFSEYTEKKFKKGNDWYCRIDIFGRRWGKNFMRWGIVPFLCHKARLDLELKKGGSLCVE